MRRGLPAPSGATLGLLMLVSTLGLVLPVAMPNLARAADTATQIKSNEPRAAAESPTESCPALGAIRWDAWFGAKGVPGMAVEKSLGPSRWHDRLPTCAEIVGPDSVRIACDSVEQMALEIDQAAAAGVDFWAFAAYADSDPMSLGLRTYLRAPNRKKIGFAMLTGLDTWGDKRNHSDAVARYVRLAREPGYQRTADGRPLIFVGFAPETMIETRFGGRASLRAIFDEFRARVRQDGSATPYMILLERDVARGAGLLQDLGLDAISAYTVADGTVREGSYLQLAQLAEGFWARVADAGLPLVPLAMTGWDRRPRVMNPVPWEGGRYSEEQMLRFFAQPTPTELQAHLTAALKRAQTPAVASRAVLVYAWNEFDEGGWLAPTRGGGSTRLGALRQSELAACPLRQLR